MALGAIETKVPLFQVDAFADKPFGGNPAAVCVLTKPRDDEWMQAVAAEMNLSETAFLIPHEDPFKQAYNLRWFTPKAEVLLCGHATLASSHVLWTEGYLRPDQTARFHTLSGELTADFSLNQWIELNFPAQIQQESAAPEGMLAALGCEAVYIGRNKTDYLVEVDSAETVYNLTPNFADLSSVECRGVIVTARSDRGEYDFISRFFAPKVGVNEDPVTGSAHCCLAPYWHAKLGKAAMVGYQASERGGAVRVEHVGDRVKLSGRAVTVFRGELL